MSLDELAERILEQVEDNKNSDKIYRIRKAKEFLLDLQDDDLIFFTIQVDLPDPGIPINT